MAELRAPRPKRRSLDATKPGAHVKLAVSTAAWPDDRREMFEAASSPLRAFFSPVAPLLSVLHASMWPGVTGAARSVVRFLSVHSGLPALVVAGILVAIGYRVLKRSARFVVQVAFITLALAAATELGWIRW